MGARIAAMRAAAISTLALGLVLVLGLAQGALADAHSAKRPEPAPSEPGKAKPQGSRPAESEQLPNTSESVLDGSEAPPSSAAQLPSYELPKVGKPRRRVGGGRRGPTGEVPSLVALAPDHVGLTTEPGPTVAWYVSDEVAGDVHFQIVLIDPTSIDPVVDDRLATPSQGGIQHVRLADHGAQLEVGEEYEWSVELVVDEEHRARDVVATGWVERVPVPDGLEERLAEAELSGRAAVFAAEGLWYDALAETLNVARRANENPRHGAQLAALLRGADIELPPESSRAP